MNNLFIGVIFRDEEVNWIKKHCKSNLQIAANNFQWNFIKGLEFNLKKPLDIFTTISMGSYPKSSSKLFVKSKKFYNGENSFFNYIGYINFYLIKGFCRFINLYYALIKWIDGNSNSIIYVYSLYSPYLWVLYFTRRKRKKKNIKYCLIVPDLFGKYGMLKSLFSIKGLWDRIESSFIYKLSQQADCYIFLTEQMRYPMNKGNKPFIVIEGLIADQKESTNNNKISYIPNEKKTILYTGSLLRDFGIEELLKAFIKIENKNYQLWICGPKAEAKTVLEYEKIDNRINYMGFLDSSEIKKLQKRATVLINPRPNIGEYVKYSFPSKTLEYLQSGRPLIMFRLDGIPVEYFNFIYVIEKFDIDTIANTIKNVCEKSEEELTLFGEKAKKFVLDNKNNLKQTSKVLELVESINFKSIIKK